MISIVLVLMGLLLIVTSIYFNRNTQQLAKLFADKNQESVAVAILQRASKTYALLGTLGILMIFFHNKFYSLVYIAVVLLFSAYVSIALSKTQHR